MGGLYQGMPGTSGKGWFSCRTEQQDKKHSRPNHSISYVGKTFKIIKSKYIRENYVDLKLNSCIPSWLELVMVALGVLRPS